MLEVVEQQQLLFAFKMLSQGIQQRPVPDVLDPKCPGENRGNEIGVPQGRQGYEDDAVGESLAR